MDLKIKKKIERNNQQNACWNNKKNNHQMTSQLDCDAE